MAKKRRTMITAGRLVTGVVYTAVTPTDAGQQRAAKLNASSAARQRINLKHSWQKCEVVLAANFGARDLVVTLTYDDDHLPPSKREAVKQLKKFIKLLRERRRSRGETLEYIYVTESKHGDGRLHHHLVINATGEDFAEIRELWTGGTDIDIKHIDLWGYTELAKYLTKEPREEGSANGARTWTPSKGLDHPVKESDWVDENLDLTAPPGAIVLDSEAKKINSFGSYTYIKYLLPETQPMRRCRPPRKAKTEKGRNLSGLEHSISYEKGSGTQGKEREYSCKQPPNVVR